MANFYFLLVITILAVAQSQQYVPDQVDERVSILENKVSRLSSRILTLEYAIKDLKVSRPEQSAPVKQVVLIQEQQPQPVVSPVVPVDMGGFRPKDCSEIREELDHTQRHSTFYTIYPLSRNRPVEVYCDMDVFGGGWTILQRRGFNEEVGREDFNRTWKEYAKGFGQLDGDYWLGLDNIAALTRYDDQEVLYEFLNIVDGRRTVTYLYYDKFQVENADNLYRLHLAGLNERYSTSLTYYLEKQNGQPFSTRDKDNAGTNNRNCRHHSGWWLQSTICHRQPDLNMPFDNQGVLQLHKYSVVQAQLGVSIKIRAKKVLTE